MHCLIFNFVFHEFTTKYVKIIPINVIYELNNMLEYVLRNIRIYLKSKIVITTTEHCTTVDPRTQWRIKGAGGKGVTTPGVNILKWLIYLNFFLYYYNYQIIYF